MIAGEIPEYTCLLGTMVQEAYATHPAIREACEREIDRARHDDRARSSPRSSPGRAGATSTRRASPPTSRRVLQGAFILAKATGDARVAADSLGHLRRYLTLLFEPQPQREALS